MTLTDALAWAQTADAGTYLITYEDSGLTNDEDPGSRCGFSDPELDEIRDVLWARDLRLDTDDLGLIAVAVEEA